MAPISPCSESKHPQLNPTISPGKALSPLADLPASGPALLPPPDRHLERVEHQVGAQVLGDLPADEARL